MASEHVPVAVRNRLSDGVVLPAELPASDVRVVDGSP